MLPGLNVLIEAVQRNCDIADARHAADLGLCTYLLEMREFYRWERGIALTDEPSRAEVGAWLERREQLWQSLEGHDFEPLPVEEAWCEPFAVETINAALLPHRLLYSAGAGRFGRAQFHLGELKREERRGDARILIGGREYARDLGSPPAALLKTTVYVRQEPFRRWLWEKFESWAMRKPDGPLCATLTAYGFAAEPLAALERMVEAETETLILHELGELEASRQLGARWEALLADAVGNHRLELALRALRDNLADCLVTLPTLLERDAAPSIHFWFAAFDGTRSELFPQLKQAYQLWRRGDPVPLQDAIAAGREHWGRVCGDVLALRGDPGAELAIERLINARSLGL